MVELDLKDSVASLEEWQSFLSLSCVDNHETVQDIPFHFLIQLTCPHEGLSKYFLLLFSNSHIFFHVACPFS